jgi:hypothetical protein
VARKAGWATSSLGYNEPMRVPRKRNLTAYHTGLYTSDYSRFPGPPFRGNGWHVNLILPQPEFQFGATVLSGKTYPAKEVVIWARTEETAQRAADLIHAARLLLDGSNFLSHIYPGEHAPICPVKPNEGSDLANIESEFVKLKRVETMNIPLACLVAARASWRLQHVYALAKLRLSFETYSLPGMELDPHQRENVPKSPLPEDHVRLAFAIVQAYSCIEELGLEVRASSARPSILPNGSWNPVVQTDLEKRLRQAHVNLKENFYWNLRGGQTRIERKRTPNLIRAAKWARQHVRDGEIAVIDAINYTSFLRSTVAAHRTDKRMVRVLSVYDVANAQYLARRLLLEKLGYWRIWGKKESR